MEIKQAVLQVYRALEEKGYNPINQLVGYILSEYPTYITTYKNARAIIRRIDRDDLLQALVRDFALGSNNADTQFFCQQADTGQSVPLM